MRRPRLVAVWAGLAAVLAALLSVGSGLAVGAVPRSWQWAHDWVLLSGVTGVLCWLPSRWPWFRHARRAVAGSRSARRSGSARSGPARYTSLRLGKLSPARAIGRRRRRRWWRGSR